MREEEGMATGPPPGDKAAAAAVFCVFLVCLTAIALALILG